MNSALYLAFPGNEDLTRCLAEAAGGEIGSLEIRAFPDGETHLRIGSRCSGADVIVVCTLARPNEMLAPLLFTAGALRDMGAGRIVLVAPYLAYLRQDRRFRDGEAVTSRYFAALLSAHVDALVTVEPHLHRYASLDEIYSIPTFAAHSAPLLADWVRQNVERPLLVGPDSESTQWVADVAVRAGAPHVVAAKVRRGDRDVEVSLPSVESYRDCTAVLIDDIISTGRTMMEVMRHLQHAGLSRLICIGVHAVFANRAYDELLAAGASQIVTCDTIPHPTNAIHTASILVSEVRRSLCLGGEDRGSSRTA